MSTSSSFINFHADENDYSRPRSGSPYAFSYPGRNEKRPHCKWAVAVLLACLVLAAGSAAVVMWQEQKTEAALQGLNQKVAELERAPINSALKIIAPVAAQVVERASPAEVLSTTLPAAVTTPLKLTSPVLPTAPTAAASLQCQFGRTASCSATYPNMCGVLTWAKVGSGLQNDCGDDGNITVAVTSNYVILSQAQFTGVIDRGMVSTQMNGAAKPKILAHEVRHFSGGVFTVSKSEHVAMDVLSSQVMVMAKLKEGDKVGVYVTSTSNSLSDWAGISLFLLPLK